MIESVECACTGTGCTGCDTEQQITSSLSVQLWNSTGTAIIANDTNEDIVINVRMRVTVIGEPDYLYENYMFTIPCGATESISQTYLSRQVNVNASTGECQIILRGDSNACFVIEQNKKCSVGSGIVVWETTP